MFEVTTPVEVLVTFAILNIITILVRRARTGHGAFVSKPALDVVLHFAVNSVCIFGALEFFAGFDTMAYQAALAAGMISSVFAKDVGEFQIANAFSLMLFIIVTPVAMMYSSELIVATPVLATLALIQSYVFKDVLGNNVYKSA